MYIDKLSISINQPETKCYLYHVVIQVDKFQDISSPRIVLQGRQDIIISTVILGQLRKE